MSVCVCCKKKETKTRNQKAKGRTTRRRRINAIYRKNNWVLDVSAPTSLPSFRMEACHARDLLYLERFCCFLFASLFALSSSLPSTSDLRHSTYFCFTLLLLPLLAFWPFSSTTFDFVAFALACLLPFSPSHLYLDPRNKHNPIREGNRGVIVPLLLLPLLPLPLLLLYPDPLLLPLL